MFVEYDAPDREPWQGRAYYVFADQVGAPVRVEDAAGEVAWRASVAPFGAAAVDPGCRLSYALRFPGHYHDEELGLHYNRFRYYSPELGRYLQPDPLGTAGGVNAYAYCPNPLAQVDLDGLAHSGQPATRGRGRRRTRGAQGAAGQPPPPPPNRRRTPQELQAIADQIHGAGRRVRPGDFSQNTTTVTQSVDRNGRVVHTVTSNAGYVPMRQRRRARELLGPDVVIHGEKPGERPNNGHHAERRGIRATRGHTEREQASSAGARHGGAACSHCHRAQRQAGVTNHTGSKPPAGTGRNVPPPWASDD
jgi:RHS repeat-associated protein